MGNGEGAAAWKKKKMAAVAGRSSRTGGVGGVLVARQLGLQALWTAILGFRAEKGHTACIKRHGCREGAAEGAGAEAAPGLPLWCGGGCWERLLPLGLGVGQLVAAG